MAKIKRKPGAKISEAHVRLYAHELKCPAYRCLSPDARALLVEFRALYNGGENRVFLSVREMMTRVGIGQRRAQAARDELLTCGWIRVHTPGGFSRKVRHATEYVLTNEPLDDRDGATAPKDFMRWQPAPKTAVAEMTAVGSRVGYKDAANTACNAAAGSHAGYRDAPISQPTVGDSAAQIWLPRECSDRDALLWAAAHPAAGDSVQLGLLVGWLLLGGDSSQRGSAKAMATAMAA